MKTTLLTGCILLAAFHSAVAADANLIGFWDFKDGAPGEDASTLACSSGDATYDGSASMVGTKGVVPYFSSDAPGTTIRGSNNGADTLCYNPQSLAFDYGEDSPSNSGTPNGGLVNFTGVAAAIIGSAEPFTVEYFVKMDENFNYYSTHAWKYNSKTSFFIGADDNGVKIITPGSVGNNGHATQFSAQLQPSGTPVSRNKDFSDGVWHHVAIVYTPTNGTVGSMEFFCDYASCGTFSYDNAMPANTRTFRLGTGRDGKLATEPFHGKVSCLRVTRAALDLDGFMRVDPVPDIAGMAMAGFWDFKDGEVGTQANLLTNSVDATLFVGKATATISDSATAGAPPTFSADAPGLYVYSDSANTNLLASHPQSLHFAPGNSNGGGGMVSLTDAATALTRLDAYTVEFFFRSEATAKWRSLVGWKTGSKIGLKVNLNNGAEGNDLSNIALEMLTNTTGNAFAQYTNSVGLTDLDALTTNKWHHMALVCDNVGGTITLYVDYSRRGTTGIESQTPLSRDPLVLGSSAFPAKAITEAYGGYIACPRITPRALGVGDFLSVAHRIAEEDVVFAWNMEEGADMIGAVATNVADYAVDRRSSADNTKVYGLFKDILPTYAPPAKADCQVFWGDEPMWTNTASLYFRGYHSLANGTQNRIYAGTEMTMPASSNPVCNPSNWTMEAMVRLEYLPDFLNVETEQTGALIFGKFGNDSRPHSTPTVYPRYAWMLSVLPNGRLKVRYALDDGNEHTDSSANYGAVTADRGHLADMKWHHVALTYDGTARKFILYVDYEQALEHSLSHPLVDGPFPYFFSRIDISFGFEGWMDEIRFTGRVLAPQEFVHVVRTSGVYIIFR